MAKFRTERIRLWGIVQGVGFRPFVAKVAERLGMKGEVANIGGLVEIIVTDTPKRIDNFINEIEKSKPLPSEIVHIARDEMETRDFAGFSIRESGYGEDEPAMIPADLAICPDCLHEMRDENNRRFGHPFISCMVCGPRYTIIDRIPYDRDNTSMIDFEMCPSCREEYENISDRRYHAQTISCHDCGPQMDFRLNGDHNAEKTEIEKAAALLKEGRVIAFKNMGGYNLIANPFNIGAVRDLRAVKRRKTKPFAVMFRDIGEIKKYCHVNEVEEKLLTSSARPIVLLERRSISELEDVRPRNYDEFEKSRFIGAFLPSMGAQYIMMDLFKGPLIVTSANLSGMPIIKDEKEMFEMLDREPLIAEAFFNERKIRVSVDDSVVRVIDDNPQMIRRSKGYAPVPLYVEGGTGSILAAGPQLKNSFALTKGPFAYVSQYFGDMDTVETRNLYEENVERLKGLFRIEPDTVVCDMHPLYYTTSFAEKYAEEHGLPLIKVQHHHAHVASVMAEHNIEGPVIGVSFDGTGYGEDGSIWGGEFLLCEGSRMERMCHLKYVGMIGGDESMKEAWKSGVSYMTAYEQNGYDVEIADDEVAFDLSEIIEYATLFGTLEEHDYEVAQKAIENNVNVIQSSSMGRLFDAVAAMLGICDYNSYEGQAAILLEDAAARAINEPGESEADDLALDFHVQVVEAIIDKCLQIREKTGANNVALTGGTFQNKIIMEETLERLRALSFEPYYNISVSPNDGGIALGQAYIAMKRKEEENDD